MLLLLVDDDPDQLAVRAMLAAQFGLDTVAAASVEEALEAVRNHAPDYALVDLRLPDEPSGLKLIRELKQIQPALRVSVLTGANAEAFEGRPERALVEEIYKKGRSSLPALLRRLQARQQSITH